MAPTGQHVRASRKLNSSSGDTGLVITVDFPFTSLKICGQIVSQVLDPTQRTLSTYALIVELLFNVEVPVSRGPGLSLSTGENQMGAVIRNLLDHLMAKGVSFKGIPSCVGTLSSIVGENPSVSLPELNDRMRRTGWKGFQWDDRTLMLMLLLVAETLLEADAGKLAWFEKHVQRKGQPRLRLVR